jgi:nucleotide-binding universal stress UspA family protein
MYSKATVPLDGSKLGESVLPHLGAFIERFNLSDVTFVRVVEFEKYSVVESPEQGNALAQTESARRSSAQDYLTKIVGTMNHDGTRFHAEIIVGRMPQSLINYLKQSNTDLVLMATHGFSALKRWFRGNVTEEILRSLKKPVFIVRASSAQGDLDAKKIHLSLMDEVAQLFS